MTWTDLWTSIGEFFEWTFKMMEALGNGPNVIMWAFIAIMVFSRVAVIARQNKKADSEGKLR